MFWFSFVFVATLVAQTPLPCPFGLDDMTNTYPTLLAMGAMDESASSDAERRALLRSIPNTPLLECVEEKCLAPPPPTGIKEEGVIAAIKRTAVSIGEWVAGMVSINKAQADCMIKAAGEAQAVWVSAWLTRVARWIFFFPWWQWLAMVALVALMAWGPWFGRKERLWNRNMGWLKASTTWILMWIIAWLAVLPLKFEPLQTPFTIMYVALGVMLITIRVLHDLEERIKKESS